MAIGKARTTALQRPRPPTPTRPPPPSTNKPSLKIKVRERAEKIEGKAAIPTTKRIRGICNPAPFQVTGNARLNPPKYPVVVDHPIAKGEHYHLQLSNWLGPGQDQDDADFADIGEWRAAKNYASGEEALDAYPYAVTANGIPKSPRVKLCAILTQIIGSKECTETIIRWDPR